MAIEFSAKRQEKLVLIAEDSATIRMLMSRVLDQAGYTYKAFEDGADLINFLRDFGNEIQIDLISLDVEMPVVHGFDACRIIKQEFPDLKAPVLFFTADDTENRMNLAQEVGGDEFIAKPFAPDKLIEKFDYWVDKTTTWDAGGITSKANRQDKLILMADDSQTIRTMATMVLEKAGFKVESFESGLGLLFELDHSTPSVIVLDVEMPVMNGFETCHKIREDFPDLTTPVLFFTSREQEDNLVYATEAGADGYILKSSPPDRLVEQVESWSGLNYGDSAPNALNDDNRG